MLVNIGRGARTIRLLVAAAVVLSTLLVARPAAAIPGPRSEKVLYEWSDVVAVVRVRQVTAGSEPGFFTAVLEVLSATKGQVKPGDLLTVTWVKVEEESTDSRPVVSCGSSRPWYVPYYPGEEVQTYLIWRTDVKVYKTTAMNAKKVIRYGIGRLPTKPGQVLTAEGFDSETMFDPATRARGYLSVVELLVRIGGPMILLASLVGLLAYRRRMART
jgi:hypothetical protein